MKASRGAERLREYARDLYLSLQRTNAEELRLSRATEQTEAEGGGPAVQQLRLCHILQEKQKVPACPG